jgi:hypothetical protein
MEAHSKSLEGCGYDLVVTMKVKSSGASYANFTDGLSSLLAPNQCETLK